MDEKITRLLGSLNYDELLRLQRDLSSGGLYLNHLVNKKIQEVETSGRSVCASCGCDFEESKTSPYTLVFGENTIKKKASFCGLDCMEDFLRDLRRDRVDVMRKQVD
ncbi:MAG: hypothetical protein ACQER9_02850 [Nanobdellota archaeon]